ncbi:hypothetical protein CDL15_Pgr027294 [Punica granatum]|uniref:Uncharacterized protein n=1 Tax=Punica granatum TaxID=22663 RepID=A0A218XS91_PUNGR|nr:hypothetical protein CDL15_Pgr027294 [Punica granatum]PKI64270.1 hypothetical protein CRG98_015343 [Punica granatum]
MAFSFRILLPPFPSFCGSEFPTMNLIRPILDFPELLLSFYREPLDSPFPPPFVDNPKPHAVPLDNGLGDIKFLTLAACLGLI